MPALTVPAATPVIHRAFAPLVGVELRDASATGDGSYTFSGYAAVTNTETTLYEGRSWVWRERIAPGAFADVLSRVASGEADYPVVLNHEHDNRAAMASTDVPASQPYGLELSEDGLGLRVFARLDPQDADVQRVVPKIRAGALSQMSFAFLPDEWETLSTEDEQGRIVEVDTIRSLRALYDVTVCAHGAYPTTTADVRGLLAASGRSGFDPEGHQEAERRAPAGAEPPTPVAPQAGGGDHDRTRRLALARARLRAAVATHGTKRYT
ncbi:MAG TPA: HK97 family phage prohead protease [Miltoncostaeaceae bacterium]|nr:HK97 family phage prohead protease [Miltoncostaeaceae bacterium]